MKLKEWANGVLAALKGQRDDMAGLSEKLAALEAKGAELREYTARLADKVNGMADNPPTATVPPEVIQRIDSIEASVKELTSISAQLADLPPL